MKQLLEILRRLFRRRDEDALETEFLGYEAFTSSITLLMPANRVSRVSVYSNPED